MRSRHQGCDMQRKTCQHRGQINAREIRKQNIVIAIYPLNTIVQWCLLLDFCININIREKSRHTHALGM